MDRSRELEGLEERLRSASTYHGFVDEKSLANARAAQALYVGLCVRELCDTLTGRVRNGS